MSLIWNLDLSTKICTYISIIFFLLSSGNWSWVVIFCGLTYYWSEIDEDDIGDDLEEYIEFFLDEFGLFDKWSNNVIESLEKYENLSEHYNMNYSDQHTDNLNAFTRRDSDYLDKPIDYDHFRENREKLDMELEFMLKRYLKLENEYEYEYRGLSESEIRNLKTAQNFYDSIHSTFSEKKNILMLKMQVCLKHMIMMKLILILLIIFICINLLKNIMIDFIQVHILY